ncbi:lymphocyte antigen 6D-like [Patiria miniata]|uniref:Protein quiver n=1 Tax=Patiria miniata TaxID=46514 RepID=A0A914AA23_PATMI|nr:lymphocyte antigen 6D-like [Patiria miniata]
MDPLRISGYLMTSALIFLVGLCLVEANLFCYDCKVDVKKSGDSRSNCIYNVSYYSPRECQSHERFCKIERVRYNRVVRIFERDCAETCSDSCETRGFGIDEETCVFCCTQDGCNNSTSSAARIDWSFGLCVSILVVGYRAKNFEN